jgi:hypothetical protein
MLTQETPDPLFVAGFARLKEAVTWNQEVGHPSAWFSTDRTETGAHVVDTWHLETAELRPLQRHQESTGTVLASHTFAPGSVEPDWLQSDQDDTSELRLGYRHRHTEGAETTIDHPTSTSYYWRDEKKAWRQPQSPAGLRPATMGRICLRWCAHAETFTELALPVGAYTDWLSNNPEEGSGDANRVGLASLCRSLIIGSERGSPYEEAAPYLDILARLKAWDDGHKALKRGVLSSLGRAVVGDAQKISQWLPVEVDMQYAFQAANAFDERGLLSGAWWAQVGISSGGVFKVPGMLEKVYQKLANDTTGEVLSSIPPDLARVLIAEYTGNLITAYARPESGREHSVAGVLKSKLVDWRGVTSLPLMTAVARGIVKDKNRRAAPGDHIRPLAVDNLGDVADALLLLAECTRARDPELAAAQFEEDVRHVEIIDMLYFGLRDAGSRKQAVTQDSTRLRYPDASTEELAEVMGQLNGGKPPATVRAWFRSRQRADREVKAQTAKTPGKGILS